MNEIAMAGGADAISIARRRRPRPPSPPVHWYASKVLLSKFGPSTSVVGDVTYPARLTPLEIARVSILKEPTQKSPDALVGFRTRDGIVNALRTKYNRPGATARSVTVGISRLRETIGPTYDALVEWRAGMGYRLRVLPP